MLLPYFNPHAIEAGCDEAGRGCLAGPVFAAAVILPKSFKNELLNDSKKLSEKQRLSLRSIIEKQAISWALGIIDNNKIDEINILNASFYAMHDAIKKLSSTPEHLLIDGNRFNSFKDIPHKCIVKGDGKYASIAAASILAKTYRDEYMAKIGLEYPVYQWKQNKGYPTKTHKLAIGKHGYSPYHRRSFNCSLQLNIQY